MDGMTFLASGDPVDRLLRVAMADRLSIHRKREQRNLAIEIYNAFAKGMSK